MYIEQLPELVIIEIDPSDEPQANIRPQSGDAQDIAFTKKMSDLENTVSYLQLTTDELTY